MDLRSLLRNKVVWGQYVRLFLERATKSDVEETYDPDTPEHEHMCWQCGFIAKSKGGCLTHARLMHGYRNAWSQRLRTTVCPACKTDFRSMMRIHNHLLKASACQAVVGLLPPMSSEELQHMDAVVAAEGRAARASGIHWSKGPPAIRNQDVCIEIE